MRLLHQATPHSLADTDRAACLRMAIGLVEHQAGGLLFELWGKRTSLLADQTPLHGDHSRLNQCLDSLDHYTRGDLRRIV